MGTVTLFKGLKRYFSFSPWPFVSQMQVKPLSVTNTSIGSQLTAVSHGGNKSSANVTPVASRSSRTDAVIVTEKGFNIRIVHRFCLNFWTLFSLNEILLSRISFYDYRKYFIVSRAYSNFLTFILRVYFQTGLLSRGRTLI